MQLDGAKGQAQMQQMQQKGQLEAQKGQLEAQLEAHKGEIEAQKGQIELAQAKAELQALVQKLELEIEKLELDSREDESSDQGRGAEGQAGEMKRRYVMKGHRGLLRLLLAGQASATPDRLGAARL